MPTYQYVCTECATPLEAVQKFTDDALTVCPTCGGKLRKLFSSVGIVFKGSGFYRTDSRSDAKASADSGGSAGGSASGSASGSSESGSAAASAGSSGESSSTTSSGDGKTSTDAKPAAKTEGTASNGTKSNGGKSDGGKSGTKPGASGGGSKTAAST